MIVQLSDRGACEISRIERQQGNQLPVNIRNRYATFVNNRIIGGAICDRLTQAASVPGIHKLLMTLLTVLCRAGIHSHCARLQEQDKVRKQQGACDTPFANGRSAGSKTLG
jgi:hypothetical protein